MKRKYRIFRRPGGLYHVLKRISILGIWIQIGNWRHDYLFNNIEEAEVAIYRDANKPKKKKPELVKEIEI